ncbi:MAG: hypothetical protein DI533_05270 [Cereibacter sphaeroides]|uniref:Uncharacterized protein n=1 Tax=Cereibacter sphaeroides TaxID=1063 RepID=A0A2W5SAI5_CERSP|nr:MAG: hypothetical protein DI533_05270 [Cereibacter sphaeroides]
MSGESDLKALLAGMEPVLSAEPYGYALSPDGAGRDEAFATVREDEGLTLVAPMERLAALGLSPQGPLARISLTIHSDLAAVGLTAAFATALGQEGISANVVAGFYHDHIFVQWDRRHDAMAALQRLAGRA